jgi:hypothetical protein
MSGACKSLDCIKAYAEDGRIEACSGMRSRKRLGEGGCYKIPTAKSRGNFRLSATINGCGEILNRNKNKQSASLVL